jgi:hypothetical protein
MRSGRLDGVHSDCGGQLTECDGEPMPAGLVGGDLIVPAPQVLDEPVTGRDYPKPGHGLDPAHRTQASFQLGLVGLGRVGLGRGVGVPVGCNLETRLWSGRMLGWQDPA